MIDALTFGAFVLCFAVGPMLASLVLRLPARRLVLMGLGLGVVGSVSAALRLQRGGMEQVLSSLVALWLAWVLAVGMVALAVSRHVTSARARRWLTVLALLTTTLPWFGLATARLMV